MSIDLISCLSLTAAAAPVYACQVVLLKPLFANRRNQAFKNDDRNTINDLQISQFENYDTNKLFI